MQRKAYRPHAGLGDDLMPVLADERYAAEPHRCMAEGRTGASLIAIAHRAENKLPDDLANVVGQITKAVRQLNGLRGFKLLVTQ